jgi:hypothetical protein
LYRVNIPMSWHGLCGHAGVISGAAQAPEKTGWHGVEFAGALIIRRPPVIGNAKSSRKLMDGE